MCFVKRRFFGSKDQELNGSRREILIRSSSTKLRYPEDVLIVCLHFRLGRIGSGTRLPYRNTTGATLNLFLLPKFELGEDLGGWIYRPYRLD